MILPVAQVASLSPTSGHRRRRWLGPAIALFALLLCLLAGEIALRVYVSIRGWTPNCYAAQLNLFRPDAANGYDLRPGFRLRSGRFEIAINRLGLRGPELSIEKQPGVQRIAIVGESAAFGYFVSDGREAARLLEEHLRESGKNVEVLNAGVPGYTVRQISRRYERDIAQLQPDIVIVYLGWNDLPAIAADNPDAERFERLPSAPTWERTLGNSTLYGFCAYRLRGPVQLAPANFENTRPTDAGLKRFRSDLDQLAKVVKKSGAKLIVCSQATAACDDVDPKLRTSLGSDPKIVEGMIALGKLLREELRTFSLRAGVPFWDVSAAISPTPDNLGDYVHLTETGEHRLAGFWSEHLLNEKVSDK